LSAVERAVTRPADNAMRIDFISDFTCPWCAIGLAGLEDAIQRLRDELSVELKIQPFELNPDLPPEGEDLADYAARKYGAAPQELAARQSLVRERAAAAGLRFPPRTRVWNTFDAHRLMQWAGIEGFELELTRALLSAYHVHGENPGSRAVLLRAAGQVGLDIARANALLAGNEFAEEVHATVHHWKSLGIHSVPSIVIDGRHLIQGAQPAELLERALRKVARAAAA
jgi:predicted DsbA family dithiol-disulfide isomerase